MSQIYMHILVLNGSLKHRPHTSNTQEVAQMVLDNMSKLMSTLSFMNFTLPPQCCTYWVGEVGQDPKGDTMRRRKNQAVKSMAEHTAKRLVEMAAMLKARPLVKTVNLRLNG